MRIADLRSTSMPVRAAAVTSTASPRPQGVPTRVSLSPAAQRLAASLAADASRVDHLKGVVQRGALAVDPLRIAQAMLAA